MDGVVMAVIGYSTFPRLPELEPWYAICCYTQDTSFGGLEES